MADHNAVPDYDLADSLALESPEQYRALFEETRSNIVSILSERAATTSELAAVLEKPKGTVGHHISVLVDAGLIHVVRTKMVRAIEAKYYGRTARTFWYDHVAEASNRVQQVAASVNAELSQLPEHLADQAQANIRHVRIPTERFAEWKHRLDDLLAEFAREPRGGETTYALAFALYPTTRPALPQDHEPTPSEPKA